MSFHSRVVRNSADYSASCLLSCLWSASISSPLWETFREWLDFSGTQQHQQVWLYNKRRSFSVWILLASQQFNQSICKEPLQMSPCKLTTYFGRKLEGAKTVQEPGWGIAIKFFACVFTERGNNHISFNMAKKEESWHVLKMQCIWCSNLGTQCCEVPRGCHTVPCLLSCVAVISSQSCGIHPIPPAFLKKTGS